MSFQRDLEFSNRYTPFATALVGFHAIAMAATHLDLHYATDLTMPAAHIAHRVRDYDKHGRWYLNEVTVRATRPSGAETELAKAEKYQVPLLFTAWVSGRDTPAECFQHYSLVRMPALLEQIKNPAPGAKVQFKDRGISEASFYSVDLRTVPAKSGVLLGSSFLGPDPGVRITPDGELVFSNRQLVAANLEKLEGLCEGEA